MTENPEERVPLPSLVADDLVDLSRQVAGRHILGDLSTDGRPYETSNGLAVAYPYAIMELLVEIRDSLGDQAARLLDQPATKTAAYAIMELLVEIRDSLGDQAARLGHVHLDQPAKKTADGLAVRLGDLEALEDRLAVELGKHFLGGRLPGVQAGVLDVLARWLRENGLLA